MGRKIAIVMNGDLQKEAPFGDPSWEVWTLGWKVPQLPRVTRAFEMHTRDQWYLTEYEPAADYPAFLASLPFPVTTHEDHADIPNANRYPFEAVMEVLGWETPHFASTISYCLGFAAYSHMRVSRVDTVGLYGVELCAAGEWAYQRPNANRLIGFLEGIGVKIVVPPTSILLGIPFKYGDGSEDENDMASARMFESLAQEADRMYKAANAWQKWEQKQRDEAKARANGGTAA